MMFRPLVLAAVFFAAASTAQAQSSNASGLPVDPAEHALTRPGAASPLRVQVAYQLQWPSPRAGSMDEQKASLSASHEAVYDLASHECEHIRAVFPGDCRMVSLNVGNTYQPFGNPAGAMNLTGNAVFEVTPTQAAHSPAPKP